MISEITEQIELVNTEEPEFTQDSDEIEALAAQEIALVEYVPKSKAPSLDTLIPRNMSFEVQKALNNVVKKHGNIDNYVRDNLKFSTVDQLWKCLKAEQVDAIGLYLSQFDREQGLIIGDQTGIGKGRQAAAVIRHAIVNGYLPIFFTKSPDLFTDMFRDLKNIDFADIRPYIINTDSDSKIKDANGHVIFSPLSSHEQYNLIVTEKEVATDSEESIRWHKETGRTLPNIAKTPTVTLTYVIDHLPSDFNVIFCTYSQIQAALPYKRQWLESLINRGVEGSNKYKRVVFILDESHMAGGYDSLIGTWMRRVLPKAKCACYLSGTFAKYPEVFPFYSKKTALQEAEMSDERFVGAMQRGGLALQEIVAANLGESGQLIRRQRSNAGVQVNYMVLDEEPARSQNRERVNRIIKLMNYVVEFEQDYIDPILDRLHAEAKENAEYLTEKPKGLGVKQSPYFSRVFTIIDQLLFSLKVEAVAQKTIDLLNENKKVVIAFKSTMGSFLNDLNLVSGDIVPQEKLDFAVTLIKGLDSVFYYNYTEITGEKSRRQISLKDLSPSGQKRYEEIKNAMKEESTGLSISPIDRLIHIIENTDKDPKLGGHKGSKFRVAEVTGRNQRISFESGEAIVHAFRTDSEKFFRLFNNGDKDVLMINTSGSTGSSAHASEDFADQRQRWMIIHQFELDINIEMQKRGRINRTGQVVLPGYLYITSDIPTERRLMFMLKAKLKQLDANTTGSQKTNQDVLESPDFLNKYGDNAASAWVSENQDLVERMGWPTYHKSREGGYVPNLTNEGAIRQVTGRAGLLTVEEQDSLYDNLMRRFEAVVKWQKQRGTYDLETEFHKLDAVVKRRFLFKQGKGGRTPFGKDTVREESIVNNPSRPFTKDQLDNILADELEGNTPRQIQLKLIEEINEKFPLLIEERKGKQMEAVVKIKSEMEALSALGGGKDIEENNKIEKQKTQLEELVNSKTKELNVLLEELETFKSDLIKTIQLFQVGQALKVPLENKSSWGVFLGTSIARNTKNPFARSNITLKFAVSDSRKVLEYNLTPEQRVWISSIYTNSLDITQAEILRVNENWNELIREASKRREKRHILTENILGAAEEIGNYTKLIKYNTKDGVIKNGILLPRNFGKNDEDKYALLPIAEAYADIAALKGPTKFEDHQNRVRFESDDDNYLKLAITKKGNFELYTDDLLRSLIEKKKDESEDDRPDFVQNAGEMVARLHRRNIERCLMRLSSLGLKYLGAAKLLDDWEEENEEEAKPKSTFYRYMLSRPYGQGSNPTISFVSYEEPSSFYPFGVVVYDRRLTDKEKYNYSLKPIYLNATEPYDTWKTVIERTARNVEFLDVIRDARTKPISEAILTLGYFITNNPHEDGNNEYVFGDFDEEALGRAAYEDLIELTEIEKVIRKLKIELEWKEN